MSESILRDKLGVQRVEFHEQGDPKVSAGCRAGMVAALALALGCSLGTPQARAAGLDQPEPTRAEVALDSASRSTGFYDGQSKQGIVMTLGGHAMDMALQGPQVAVTQSAAKAATAAGLGAALGDSGKAVNYAGAGIGLAAAIASGGTVAIALGAKGAWDAYQNGEQMDAVKAAAKSEERAKRHAEIVVQERERALNQDRESRSSWPEALRENDQRRTLEAAKVEYDQSGTLTTPALQERFGLESQRAADGLETEPWFGKYQEHVQARELQVERELGTPDIDGYHG